MLNILLDLCEIYGSMEVSLRETSGILSLKGSPMPMIIESQVLLVVPGAISTHISTSE